MVKRYKVISFTMFLTLANLGLAQSESAIRQFPPELTDLSEARHVFLRDLEAISTQQELTGQPMTAATETEVLKDFIRFRGAYAGLDRHQLNVEILYEAQFQLRFVNFKLKETLARLFQKGLVTKTQKQDLELAANIINDSRQDFYRVPKKSLPIEGIKGSDWPLSRWENDPEFYNYTFDGDEVLFRGLRLRAGDLLLNHPIEKPAGLFGSLAEQRNLFSHAAMIAILHKKQGRLPVVIDVHERGVRAVPLYHYLGPKVLGYAEVFRFRDYTGDFESRLDRAVRQLMSVEHPYDLTGSEDRKALSCMEMVSYVLELMGQPKIDMNYKIEDHVYRNILRLGQLDYQRIQFPNDGFLDQRFSFVGVIDNPQSLETLVSNEVLLDLFREKIVQKIMKDKKDLGRIFGEIAIAQVRSKHSLFGGFILKATGFNRENFPAGDPGLLTAVNSIDFILSHAMGRCLGLEKIVKSKACEQGFQRSAMDGLEQFDYSILKWKANPKLRALANRELRKLDEMFE